MAEEVLIGEGLFHHQEIKLIEGAQPPRVVRGIGGVGIHLEGEIRKALPYSLQDLEIPAGLDLELHPLVALLREGGYLLKE
jgi:hypothetical protein